MRPPTDALPVKDVERDTDGLEVHYAHHNTYMVDGHTAPHFVYYDGERGSCDCADFIWRDRQCKHITAVHGIRRDTNTRSATETTSHGRDLPV